MNITMFNGVSNRGNSIFAGSLPIMQRPTLKSTQEKAERQQKSAGQIEYWEKQKENLKNMECDTLEGIAAKLDKLDSYENEIAAVKMQYNQEQMWHVMDEAKEIGEKIAEAAEKFEPKTAEERREEMAEEALGTDENKGELLESLEDMQEEMAELAEEMSQTVEEISESAEKTLDSLTEERIETAEEASAETSAMDEVQEQLLEDPYAKYKRIDLLV